ncbi:MAG: CvpA family protein [Planctomycetales bacterium]|nr:CvpA family protein [Planctomycetales bacterium]MCA9207519.1 CvpA family protein [Planctomycetales bacterium]
MDVYDLLMLIVLAGATIFGAYKGLAWQLASIGSMLLSYVVAVRLREPVSQMIDTAPPWNRFAAMLILYIGTSLAIWIAFRFVSASIDRLKLKEFDRQIGALFGFAKGVALCTIVTLFAVTALGEERRQTVIHSRSGYYIALLLDRAHGLMPEEYHTALHPYLHELDPEMRAHRHDADDPTYGQSTPTPQWPDASYPDGYPSNAAGYPQSPPMNAPYGANNWQTGQGSGAAQGGYAPPSYGTGEPYGTTAPPAYGQPYNQPYDGSYSQQYGPYTAPAQPTYPAPGQPTYNSSYPSTNGGYPGPYDPTYNNGSGYSPYAAPPANVPSQSTAPTGRAPAPRGELLNLPALLREALR